MKFFIRVVVAALVTVGLSYLLPGVYVSSLVAAGFFSLVLSVLNAVLKPILQILGLPITLLTFGLFSLIINTVVLLMAANFTSGVTFDGFLWALIFGVALSFCTSIIYSLADLD